MRNRRLLTLAEVENSIISAIELTDAQQGEQSEVWTKVYAALADLADRAKERNDRPGGSSPEQKGDQVVPPSARGPSQDHPDLGREPVTHKQCERCTHIHPADFVCTE